MADLIKTQHFTNNYSYILKNIKFYPTEAVDPFAGACDLYNYSPNTKWTFYDIDTKLNNVIYNDSLLNPIDYTGKNVITNPPYLAKNKTKEFADIFEKYGVDDLYKASIISIIGCEKGILIIPINFFTDEVSKDVRKLFLKQYKVTYVNVFDTQVFDNTTYNVCSFYFEKGITDDVQFYNVDKDISITTTLKEEYGFRLGGEFYNSFSKVKNIFSRVTDINDPNATNIYVECLDKRNKRIFAEYRDTVFVGKNTDRIFATLSCKRKLSEQEQRNLIDKFNNFLNTERDKYNNLILTNYRDFGRKRINFDDVYKIFSSLI